jgi:hypothetical protein
MTEYILWKSNDYRGYFFVTKYDEYGYGKAYLSKSVSWTHQLDRNITYFNSERYAIQILKLLVPNAKYTKYKY